MAKYCKTVFPNLEKEMKKKNYSQKYIAAEIGICENSVMNKLHGKRDFTLREIFEMLRLFPGYTFEYLFCRSF